MTPAEDRQITNLRARQQVLRIRAAAIRRSRLTREEQRMAHRPNRPQSGMFDSGGDGHPDRGHYLPAHGACEPAESPQTATPAPEASEPTNGPQTGR